MVVLDVNMLGSTGPNQYLQPDYLGPLPSTLDSKQSPLALLAQTCSQIGADPSPTQKALESKRKSSTCSDASGDSSSHRPKSSSSSASSSKESAKLPNGKSSPTKSPGFRPYDKDSSPKEKASEKERERDATSNSSSSNSDRKERERDRESRESRESKGEGKDASSSSDGKKTPSKRPLTTPPPEEGRKRSAPPPTSQNSSNSSHSNSEEKSKKSRQESGSGKSSPQGSSPIIRSGLEVLQGNDFRKLGYPLPPSLYPNPFENPAFRPPFSQFSPFPPTGSPYIGYSRVKTANGAESIVPVCKDPYCTGCQFSAPHHSPSASSSSAASLMAAAAGFSPAHHQSQFCPLGCLHPCEHPKIPLPPNPFLASHYPPSVSVAVSSASASLASAAARPYVCNWIVGESYCGKRFSSSEELLQHLRTHPNTAANQGQQELAAAAMLQHQAAYSSLLSLRGGYPGASAQAAAAAAAYNPYMASAAAMKGLFPPPPPVMPGGGLGALPPSLAGLYNPYGALYGQKIPSVHP